ncbi:hypothetical protein [Streptomyces katrae]|uniref:hypothetical protein n=1 Tax=Streptomyces katrae TaxID=68223 RepID=UPI0004C2410A|nr:hypothetical protein [Streptomyces katrae]
MSTPSPIPAAAQAATAEHCGRDLVLTEVTDRRGSAVWKAAGPEGTAALKVGRGDGVEVTAREAAALAALEVDYFVGGGVTHGAAWLLTDWLEGPSTWEVFAPVRAGGADRQHALAAAADLCSAVAVLHAAGWVHADLQPSHGIHTPDGVKLIDLAWAWRPGWDQGNNFNGGMTHLLSPELAAAIITGDKPVVVTPAADVYALAGTLWACATGTWPLDYQAAAIDPQTCTPHELRQHIATGRVPVPANLPWPELQEVLLPVLLDDPANRPTAGELGKALEALSAEDR